MATKSVVEQLGPSLAALQAAGIQTVTEARVLHAVATSDQPTMGEIAHKLKMPFSTTSRVIFSLHELGLLSYAPHPIDRRKKVLKAHTSLLS